MSEFEKYLCPQCGTMQESLKAELARRDEIISRLKEDAEKLSEHLILDSKGYFPHIQEQIRLDILAHRTLMKELE